MLKIYSTIFIIWVIPGSSGTLAMGSDYSMSPIDLIRGSGSDKKANTLPLAYYWLWVGDKQRMSAQNCIISCLCQRQRYHWIILIGMKVIFCFKKCELWLYLSAHLQNVLLKMWFFSKWIHQRMLLAIFILGIKKRRCWISVEVIFDFTCCLQYTPGEFYLKCIGNPKPYPTLTLW